MRSMHTGKNQSLGSMRSVNQQTGPTWLRARRRPTVLIRKDSPTPMLNTDVVGISWRCREDPLVGMGVSGLTESSRCDRNSRMHECFLEC